MNLDSLVKTGREPWLPSDEACALEVWHMDDAPTIGRFKHRGRQILFSAVRDIDEPITLWGYVCLTDAEAEAAEAASFEDMSEMLQFVDERFAEREIVVAAAVDFAIVRWGREHEQTLLLAASCFLQRWVDAMRREAPAEVQFDAFRAGAEEYHRGHQLTTV
jgi:glutathione S-transferase